jgi:hypothetical protein
MHNVLLHVLFAKISPQGCAGCTGCVYGLSTNEAVGCSSWGLPRQPYLRVIVSAQWQLSCPGYLGAAQLDVLPGRTCKHTLVMASCAAGTARVQRRLVQQPDLHSCSRRCHRSHIGGTQACPAQGAVW